jgi:hypothetical protein
MAQQPTVTVTKGQGADKFAFIVVVQQYQPTRKFCAVIGTGPDDEQWAQEFDNVRALITQNSYDLVLGTQRTIKVGDYTRWQLQLKSSSGGCVVM